MNSLWSSIPPNDHLDELSPEQLGLILIKVIIDGNSSLHHHLVKACIDAGADLEVIDPVTGYSALHRAAQNHSVIILKTLIAAGADLNHKTEYGSTALHLAVKVDRVNNIKALLKAKASKDALDKRGCTPWYYATEDIRREVPWLEP